MRSFPSVFSRSKHSHYVVRGTVLVGDPLMDRMTDGSTPADRFLSTIGFPVTSYVEFEKEVGKKKSMVVAWVPIVRSIQMAR